MYDFLTVNDELARRETVRRYFLTNKGRIRVFYALNIARKKLLLQIQKHLRRSVLKYSSKRSYSLERRLLRRVRNALASNSVRGNKSWYLKVVSPLGSASCGLPPITAGQQALLQSKLRRFVRVYLGFTWRKAAYHANVKRLVYFGRHFKKPRGTKNLAQLECQRERPRFYLKFLRDTFSIFPRQSLNASAVHPIMITKQDKPFNAINAEPYQRTLRFFCGRWLRLLSTARILGRKKSRFVGLKFRAMRRYIYKAASSRRLLVARMNKVVAAAGLKLIREPLSVRAVHAFKLLLASRFPAFLPTRLRVFNNKRLRKLFLRKVRRNFGYRR